MGRLSRRFSVSRPSALLPLIIAQLATVAGAFAINILSARALGPEARGEIALLLQLSYIAGAVLPLGRDRALLQAVPTDHSTIYFLARRLSRVPLFIALVAVAAVGLWRTLSGDTPSVIFTMSAGFGLLLVSNLFSRFTRSAAILTKQASRLLFATALGQVLLVAAGTILLAQGVGSVGLWLLLYGGALLAPFAITIPLITASSAPATETSTIKEIESLGAKLLPASLIDMLMTKADRIALPILAGYASLGYYAVAMSLVDFAILPVRQYVDSKIPIWAKEWRSGHFHPAPQLALLGVVAIILVIATVGASYVAIPLLFGREYVPALSLLPWLGLATLFHISTVVIAGVATALALTAPLRSMYLGGVACAIPAHLLLIPLQGATGAAIGQATGYAVSTAIGSLLVLQRLRVSTSR